MMTSLVPIHMIMSFQSSSGDCLSIRSIVSSIVAPLKLYTTQFGGLSIHRLPLESVITSMSCPLRGLFIFHSVFC